ncbi:MAG: hypothetical protein Q9220_006211 [cf. Caloplaca sp. 1 TL-2023]
MDEISQGRPQVQSNVTMRIDDPGQGGYDDAVAVIGIGVKLPQNVNSTEAFWQMLVNRQSALSDVPKDRFNVDAFYNADGSEPGMFDARQAHFVRDDIAAFDAPFFSISPAEAECMDPQQRWLLETTYHAFENAGLSLENVASSKTSVHVGSFSTDFGMMLSKDPEFRAQHRATGTSLAMLANRISWFYDLTGPSIAVDTACSSSLNALDLACQSIRSGQSTMGVVAGSNIILGPESSAALADLGFLSPDSKCYSFDHRANGYSRGEGIAIVVIKPLAQALQDNDTIRAVIRATRSNQDGRTPGVTQPSSIAHESLIRSTYISAGLDMGLTQFFEAHGTGTSIGDPTEAFGIYSAFKDRPNCHPLRIGAVKTNIGHLEGASGLAGLIKTILVVEKGVIPPNVWFEKPNKAIDCAKWNIEPIPWPTDGLRRASVSSFGFGGSNCHVVIDDAYKYTLTRGVQANGCTALVGNDLETANKTTEPDDTLQHSQGNVKDFQTRILVWSAHDEKGLERLRKAYQEYSDNFIPAQDEARYLANLSFTLAAKRTHMAWKTFLTVNSVAQLKEQVRQPFALSRQSIRRPGVVFVFTGQGAEWAGMGKGLLGYRAFEESLKRSQTALSHLGCTWNMLDEMGTDATRSKLTDPAYSQPICTALQVALVALLRDWGVKAAYVIGHSSGEIAAAYCAGAISQESAIKISYHRGRLVSSLAEKGRAPGAMMAVGLGEMDLLSYLSAISCDDKLCVACINSPRSTTVAGPAHLVHTLGSLLDRDGVFHRTLTVKVAYHSPAMEETAEEYSSAVAGISAGSEDHDFPRMLSSVTGEECSSEDLRNPDYWTRNLVSRVRFSSALRQISSFKSRGKAATKFDVDLICEIGPHGALKGPIRDNVKDLNLGPRVNYTSLLMKGHPATSTLMEAAGAFYYVGCSIDLLKTSADFVGTANFDMLTDLPPYPFDRTKRYWGETTADWNKHEARWTNSLSVDRHPWVKDHEINNTLLYPAAGFIIMAIEAARQTAPVGERIAGYHFREVIFAKAAVIPIHGKLEAQITLRQSDGATRNFLNWNAFHIYMFHDSDAVEIAHGSIALKYEKEASMDDSTDHCLGPDKSQLSSAATGCKIAVTSKQFYSTLGSSGLAFGPTFQPLKAIRYDGRGSAVACVDPYPWTSKSSNSSQPSIIHPGALDAILQIPLVVLTDGGRRSMSTMVPTTIDHLQISSRFYDCHEQAVDISARLESVGGRSAKFSSTVSKTGHDGLLVHCQFEAKAVADSSLSSSHSQTSAKRLCYNIEWKPDLELMANEEIETYCSSWSVPPLDLNRLMFPEKHLVCRWALVNVGKLVDMPLVGEKSSHFSHYLDWVNHQLSCDNFKMEDITSIKADEIEQLLRRMEEADPIGKSIVRVARNLKNILEGNVDALHLLFHDGLMDDYYRFSNQLATSFRSLDLYVDLLAHKRSNLNILEIGAGTGSATRDILHVLTQDHIRRFGEYTFTDVSASFFPKAREDFRDQADRMKFMPLDIEKDPLQQGFMARYDVVVASNCLHATSNLENTLRNARKLLKSGGKIIIFESVNPESIISTFIFGLLPGWWLGTESFRKWGPLVNEDTWNLLLKNTGFSGVDVSFRTSLNNGRDKANIMIGCALDIPDEVPRRPRTVLLDAQALNGLGSDATSTLLTRELHSALVEQCQVEAQLWSTFSSPSSDLENTTFILYSNEHTTGLTGLSARGYANLQTLVSSAAGLLWVLSSDSDPKSEPCSETINGLLRGMQSERENLKAVLLRLLPTTSTSTAVNAITKVFQHQFLDLTSDPETEYQLGSSLVGIPRIVEAKSLNKFVWSKNTRAAAEPKAFGDDPARRLKLSIANPGLLESLQFIDDPQVHEPIAPDEVEIEVKAAGVNFLDVLTALGQVSSENIGRDCAGIVSRAGSRSSFAVGDRVVSITLGAYQTRARCKAAVACLIPHDMSFTTAAALPATFLTAYCALVEVARVRPQETVLIHSAAGGTGQACIQIAQLYGAEVYATVGGEEKRALLRETYGIPDDHIFTSRSPAFTSGIKAMTNGRGVNIVVNSLAGEALRNTWEECLAPLGRFIELGKKDITSFGYLSMKPFAKNVTFSHVDLMLHLHETPAEVGRLLKRIVDLLQDGKISVQRPLTVFDASRIEEAFRLMQSGKNQGKMVITFGSQDIVPTVRSSLPKYYFDENATYVIAGGLGGLGRSLARWMASRKARYLILLGSSNPIREAGKNLVDDLTAQGLTIATPSCDISDRNDLEQKLNRCLETMPPIKGCIQGAMVLKDDTFANMSYENFQAVLRPKVQGSWNLHTLLPRNLDFFVLLSSIAGIIGNYGQANYAAGNTYQDALAHHRVRHGERAISVDLGTIRSVGYIAERDDLVTTLRTDRFISLEESEFLALMEHCCDPALQLSTQSCQIVTGLQTAAALRQKNISEPLFMNRPMFRHLYALDEEEPDKAAGSSAAATASTKHSEPDYQLLLSFAPDPDDAASIITEGIRRKLGGMMQLELADIDTSLPLHRFGVDSLAAIELKTWLARAVRADVAIFDLLSNRSVDELGRLAAERSELVGKEGLEGRE